MKDKQKRDRDYIKQLEMQRDDLWLREIRLKDVIADLEKLLKRESADPHIGGEIKEIHDTRYREYSDRRKDQIGK